MWRIARGDPRGRVDCREFLAFLDRLAEHPRGRELLSGGGEVVVSRAPGRLDVMGGIADYSGALVLQLPLALATLCAAARRTDRRFRLLSDGPAGERHAEVSESDARELATVDGARRWFAARAQDRWCAYVLGILAVWNRAFDFVPPCGLDLVVRSRVPEGAGISSSAALEVASARAIAKAYGVERDPLALALDCQQVENHVVGAACGAMDQVTAMCGVEDRLLELSCQPAAIQGHLAIPPELSLWGIDSGVRHSVAGDAYTAVRVGAFMGHRILLRAIGAGGEHDDPWRGYLANVSVEDLERRFAGILPERIEGREFLERYGDTIDPATRVDPERSYPVRAATVHPIREQARIRRFASLLREPAPDLAELGRAMYASHASYGACGLGSPETDRIVQRAEREGPAAGIYGAKITGGGSGGTVAVLTARDAEAAVHRLAAGLRVYRGSSPGAASFGDLRLAR